MGAAEGAYKLRGSLFGPTEEAGGVPRGLASGIIDRAHDDCAALLSPHGRGHLEHAACALGEEQRARRNRRRPVDPRVVDRDRLAAESSRGLCIAVRVAGARPRRARAVLSKRRRRFGFVTMGEIFFEGSEAPLERRPVETRRLAIQERSSGIEGRAIPRRHQPATVGQAQNHPDCGAVARMRPQNLDEELHLRRTPQANKPRVSGRALACTCATHAARSVTGGERTVRASSNGCAPCNGHGAAA